MIEPSTAFKTIDGEIHPYLASAQAHALGLLGLTNAGQIIENSEAIMSILGFAQKQQRKPRVVAKPAKAKAEPKKGDVA